jgi:hypothetical protein
MSSACNAVEAARSRERARPQAGGGVCLLGGAGVACSCVRQLTHDLLGCALMMPSSPERFPFGSACSAWTSGSIPDEWLHSRRVAPPTTVESSGIVVAQSASVS